MQSLYLNFNALPLTKQPFIRKFALLYYQGNETVRKESLKISSHIFNAIHGIELGQTLIYPTRY